MTQSISGPTPRLTLTSRPNASRKLLARKAAEKLALLSNGDSVEDSFPPAPGNAATNEQLAAGAAMDSAPPELPVPSLVLAGTVSPTVPAATPQPTPAWSNEDERTFKAQSARRKAAGYRMRGRDVGGQQFSVGNIKPNPSTTVAVIVGLVAARGSIARAELVAAMASVSFPHPKARPADPGWCQGYVAGAIRNGFLTVATEHSTLLDEPSAEKSEER